MFGIKDRKIKQINDSLREEIPTKTKIIYDHVLLSANLLGEINKKLFAESDINDPATLERIRKNSVLIHKLASASLLCDLNQNIFLECEVNDETALEQIRKNCVLIQSLLK